jgi:hypothetical protein
MYQTLTLCIKHYTVLHTTPITYVSFIPTRLFLFYKYNNLIQKHQKTINYPLNGIALNSRLILYIITPYMESLYHYSSILYSTILYLYTAEPYTVYGVTNNFFSDFVKK